MLNIAEASVITNTPRVVRTSPRASGWAGCLLSCLSLGVVLHAPARASEPYLVKDINPNGGSMDPLTPEAMDGLLYFNATDDVNGQELWVSNGTEGGTRMVADIVLGWDGSEPHSELEVNHRLFFLANDNIHGWELWVSDGTGGGTGLLKDINPSNESNPPGNCTYGGLTSINMVDLSGTLFFAADDGDHGREVWKSDGTEEGTVMVKDISPGDEPSRPTQLTDVDGVLFFRADDAVHGGELWKSDGTEQGTVLVGDINPGPDPSSPIGLTVVGGLLMFSAGDNIRYRELWAVRLTPIPSISEWGLVILTLLVLSLGSGILIRRRRTW